MTKTGNIFLRMPPVLNRTLAQGKSIIIAGEQGCGKTLAASALQSQFIKYKIDEEWTVELKGKNKKFHFMYITNEPPPYDESVPDLMIVTPHINRRTNGDTEITFDILHSVVEVVNEETRAVEITNGIVLSEKKRLAAIETFRHCKTLLTEMPDADFYLERGGIKIGGDFLIDDIDRSIASLQQKRKDDGG